MWALGLSLTSILALLLTGKVSVFAVKSSSNKHDNHTTISKAAKALKKVTRRGSKLIDARNINR